MNIIDKNIDELREYKNNPRMNEAAVEAVANSIREFGFKVPIIIDADGVIVAGHTRKKAAERLGLKTVPCIVADDLTPEQVKAFRLADNKVAELADWDEDKLAIELDAIDMDMEQFGFLEDFEQEIEEEIIKPEEEFTESLEEEHNYIVLFFKNDIDWLQAQSLFDIKPVKNLAKSKTGKITKGSNQIGIGRVIDGAKALDKILEVQQNENKS